MDYFFFVLLLVTLPVTFSSSGHDVIRVTAVKGEDCALPCPRNKTLELSLLQWTHVGESKLLLVFRGAVRHGYEDPLYTNRVELLDPQLQTDLGVVLKKLTVDDSGEYECLTLYEDGQKELKTSQLIHLTVTNPGRTKTEINTNPSRRLTYVLGFGLFILIIIVLCVLFQKQIKLFDLCECSCFEELTNPPIPRSSASSSAPPILPDGPLTS